MNRVLVIRFSSLGDIVLSSTVVGLLQERNPDLIIDYLVHERFSSLVAHFDPPPNNIIAFPPSAQARDLPGFAQNLANNRYDLVIDLHDSLRSKILRRFLQPIDLRVYRKPRLKRWLLFYGYINRFSEDYAVVSEYLRYAGLKNPTGKPRPKLAVSDSEAGEICQQFGLQQDIISCVPGAAWPQKSWIPERYTEFFTVLPDTAYSQIALLGGPHDDICDSIAGSLPASKIVNLKGKTSLPEALAVLSRSRMAIGSDTGLLHAAEALNVPVAMILGPTSKETGARVHHPDSRAIATDLWCRPCSQNGKRRCYRSRRYCITNISVDKVAAEVSSMLGIS
ncbi:glycosyltransferase family 9 protein [Candidatus Neomarinimicrobiota bacterium]